MPMQAVVSDDVQIETSLESLKSPIIEHLKKEAESYLASVRLVTVKSNEDLENAALLRDGGATRYKALWSLLDEPCKDAAAFHKAQVKKRDSVCDPYQYGSALVKKVMIAWDEEQKRLQRLEQIRLEREAKQKADDDALALAAELEKAGLTQEAQEVISAPAAVAPVVAPKMTPKIDNFSYRGNFTYKVHCLNCKTWIKYTLVDQHGGHNFDFSEIPLEYKIPDFNRIAKIVRAMKGATNIPGIEVYEEKV